MDKTSLGDRMKTYEKVTESKLIRRIPVIVRIDGKAFHTLTKGMERPFDNKLSICMNRTAYALAEKVMGCVFVYTQSDEISLLLVDYTKLETEPWFGNKLQKIVSVTASMATAAFNHEFMAMFPERYDKSPAMFDARAFNIPKDEVVNYFIERQQDATRNSVQMVGRAYFSHKQLHKKNNEEIQDMLFKEKDVNWNDTPTKWKRGVALYKKEFEEFRGDESAVRNKVYIDTEIPIFTQDREFIQRFVDVKEDD